MNDPIKEYLYKVQLKAEYDCDCSMCTIRYCDDDIKKSRDYRTDIPKLLALIRIYREANQIDIRDNFLKNGSATTVGWCNGAYIAEQKALEVISND